MNQAQLAHLKRYGLTEATFASAHPSIRLEVANLAHVADPAPAPSVPLTDAQLEYLGVRTPDQLSDPLDIENFEALGGDIFKDNIPSAAPKPTKLDPAKLEGKGPVYRLTILESFEELERAKASPGSIDQRSLDNARTMVEPYLS